MMGTPFLQVTTEKYLSLGKGTIEDEQKPQKEYKDYKINFTEWIHSASVTALEERYPDCWKLGNTYGCEGKVS